MTAPNGNGSHKITLVVMAVASLLGAGGSYLVPSKDVDRLHQRLATMEERLHALEVRERRDPCYGAQCRAMEREIESLNRWREGVR
jgi:uncharacterized protein involved in exopolysaccharide biosynthesis